MAELKYSADQYHGRFNPKLFLNLLDDENLKGFYQFFLKEEHKFWSKLPHSSSTEAEVRCLEYGGGPSLFHLISAAPKVDRIVFAEFTEANREEVLSWLAGNTEAYNWSPSIKYVTEELEGDQMTESVSKRENELKMKLKSVVPCDVYKSPIVSLEDFDCGKLFDVVSTSLCLESCVSSEEQYISAVVKLCEFIKPGGYLRMNGALESTWYWVGNEKLFTFPLTKILIQKAMDEAKLQDVSFEIFKQDNTDGFTDCLFWFHVFGRKSNRE